MGNIRRIKKQINQQIALVDTKTAFNSCKILLGNPNPSVAKKAAVQFADFLAFLNSRAKCFNMGDFYKAHFALCERFKLGKTDILGDMKVDNDGQTQT